MASSSDRVVVTTLVAVDPAAAFEIFTEDVDVWWKRGPRYRFLRQQNGRMRFERGVGGRLVEVYDDAKTEVFEVGKVLAWDPAERLVFEFRARDFRSDDVTEVEVRFEPEGDGTRVTVEHRGWDSLPPEHPARHGFVGEAFTNMLGTFWADLLVSLRRASTR